MESVSADSLEDICDVVGIRCCDDPMLFRDQAEQAGKTQVSYVLDFRQYFFQHDALSDAMAIIIRLERW